MLYKTETCTKLHHVCVISHHQFENRVVNALTRCSKNTSTIITQSLNLYYVYFISRTLNLYVYLSIMSLKTIRR